MLVLKKHGDRWSAKSNYGTITVYPQEEITFGGFELTACNVHLSHIVHKPRVLLGYAKNGNLILPPLSANNVQLHASLIDNSAPLVEVLRALSYCEKMSPQVLAAVSAHVTARTDATGGSILSCACALAEAQNLPMTGTERMGLAYMAGALITWPNCKSLTHRYYLR